MTPNIKDSPEVYVKLVIEVPEKHLVEVARALGLNWGVRIVERLLAKPDEPHGWVENHEEHVKTGYDFGPGQAS